MAMEIQTQAKSEVRESAIPRWVLPVGGLAAAGVLALGFLMGWIGDNLVAMLMAVAFTAIVAGIALKAVLEHAFGGLRVAALVFVALIAFVSLYPAREMLMPGQPVAEAELDNARPEFQLPGPGGYHLLVSSQLSESGDPTINYTLSAGDQSLHGTLERVHATRRVGRRGSMQVTEDHNIVAHDLRVSGEAPAVHLQKIEGHPGSTLLVRAYRALPPWLMWAAILVLLIGSGALDLRMGVKGTLAMTSVAAICFGLLMESANPGSSLGAVFGSALLAAGGGALGGSLLGGITRKLLVKPAPEKAEKKGARRTP